MKKLFISLSLILISHQACAYITSDIVAGCNASTLSAANNVANMIPAWTISSYTCSSGQFLPADTTECKSCPTGYTCSGGTFDFNEHESQGLEHRQNITQSTQYTCSTNFLNSVNNTTNMIPVFTPNTHNCNPGYYLPANVDACTICPKDNYCGGGTYTFNETTPQGITPCSGTTPYAPAGSPVCYPRMMHLSDERPEDVIYLKSTETTTPAFHVNINGTVYHANLTTTPTYMTSASTHYLKIMVDNVEYYVCDDTTYSE